MKLEQMSSLTNKDILEPTLIYADRVRSSEQGEGGEQEDGSEGELGALALRPALRHHPQAAGGD